MNPADIAAVEAIEAKLEAEYWAAVRAKHRKQYCKAVKSDPGEPDGPNSYPVPWMWTDSYRYAPSELSFMAGESDPDYDAWYANATERWAHSAAQQVWHNRKLGKKRPKWMFTPNRRQRARIEAAS